jgi:hypothetical protein
MAEVVTFASDHDGAEITEFRLNLASGIWEHEPI